MNRDELYRRIRETSKDEVILEEMIRLGFWPEDEGRPELPTDLLRRRGELRREAGELRQKHQRLADPKAMLAAEQRRRIEASRARRAERRRQRAAEAKRRAEAWRERKQAEVLYLGEGVSAGLTKGAAGKPGQVATRGLPVLQNPQALAEAIGISLGQLRWLSFHRKGATVTHYARFTIPKKTGGVRHISAPMPLLRRAQTWIKETILDRLGVAEEAHGFVVGRSIQTNAALHTARGVVINLDLEDFFPSFGFRRVKGFFRSLSYGEDVATVLALLCTEPPRVPVVIEGGDRYHVALGQRVLPQGSCCSPALTNLICRRLDRRLAGLARKHGVTYSRYADDITLSGDRDVPVGRLLGRVRSIVEDEGLRVHPQKTRVLRRGRRQEVTGLVVNDDAPAVARRVRRELRAILHNAKRSGLQSQNRSGRPDFLAHLRGRIGFVEQIQPRHGKALRAQLDQILRDA